VKRTRSSAASPVVSTHSVPSGAGKDGSTKEQSASGVSSVPNLIKPKKLLLKKSSQ